MTPVTFTIMTDRKRDWLMGLVVPVVVAVLGFAATGYLQIGNDVAVLKARVEYLEREVQSHILGHLNTTPQR